MLRRLKRAIGISINDVAYLKIKYLIRFGRIPNTKAPPTFNEKLLCYKLNLRGQTSLVQLVDKIEAKRLVAAKVGSDHIIPTLWFGEALPARSERNWPKPYVLKSSHGSGQNHFVRFDQDEDWDEIEPIVQEWLGRVYGHADREWMYTKVPPRLLVEPYMGNGDTLPVDYKFFVFNGAVKMIQVDLGRGTDHRRDLFTPQWRRFDFEFEYPNSGSEVPPPKMLPRMIEIAERLSEGLSFVRCDLYEINGQVYFGELTFFPEGGMGLFSPREADLMVGNLWDYTAQAAR